MAVLDESLDENALRKTDGILARVSHTKGARFAVPDEPDVLDGLRFQAPAWLVGRARRGYLGGHEDAGGSEGNDISKGHGGRDVDACVIFQKKAKTQPGPRLILVWSPVDGQTSPCSSRILLTNGMMIFKYTHHALAPALGGRSVRKEQANGPISDLCDPNIQQGFAAP